MSADMLLSSWRGGEGHCRIEAVCADCRARMSSYELFPITDLPLILHNHTAAATNRLYAIVSETSVQLIQLTHPCSLDCSEDPYIRQ